MMTSTIPDLESLLGADFDFRFVGEGAANIVFEIIQSQEDSNALLKGKLLRVPKSRTVALDYLDVQNYWETAVKPLFKDGDLVNQSLVKIGAKQQIISRMNAAVAQVEATRRKDFQGSCVSEAEYGMLVDDMRKKNQNDTVLEFKPKWLSQSPDAPPTAIRCRNCAKEALRNHDKKITNPPSVLCSIDLLALPTNTQSRARVLAILLTSSSSHNHNLLPSSTTNLLAHWLQSNTLLPALSLAQRTNDDKPEGGCLDASPDRPNPKLDLAMTLRDCTCFVRIPAGADSSDAIEAKLADLDKKNGAAKLRTWQGLERRLVEEGFYTEPRPRGDWTCLLERGEGEGTGQ